MNRRDDEQRNTPSVLDRLIDLDPKSTQESLRSRNYGVAELKQSVRRDLEWLLNTRRKVGDIPETLEEVSRSLAVFGLPDIISISAADPNEQKRLTKEIENAIRLFEPRFLDVRVSLEPFDIYDRSFRFRIEATLNSEPVPEPIAFDTVLQFGSNEFILKER
jgi:type VI secretion system protein ImpF